jgi:hypothetical protein
MVSSLLSIFLAQSNPLPTAINNKPRKEAKAQVKSSPKATTRKRKVKLEPVEDNDNDNDNDKLIAITAPPRKRPRPQAKNTEASSSCRTSSNDSASHASQFIDTGLDIVGHMSIELAEMEANIKRMRKSLAVFNSSMKSAGRD